ncbi:Rne/Rng family ribonuclease [Jiella sonneratiae]|uniref:Ribonuclease E n=1 Tax=Jiella sonneratiae TaxID=2816856 RepID=A0ABS3IXD4_9HYPH|nr:ribonuclease E/G [Jiella sonneratiae]MBO0902070.1 Rne/Rng family ribonuclease [Jiella sonneratiae]
MANKMLIDASHQEETRVVVVRGSRIEEFDFESEHKKQLKGNIYLAKVTRVEPSLQAAFVEYGGNRHGFLAFSEIHPDYYQIPKADREALIAEEMARGAEEDEDDADEAKPRGRSKGGSGRRGSRAARRSETDTIAETVDAGEAAEGADAPVATAEAGTGADEAAAQPGGDEAVGDADAGAEPARAEAGISEDAANPDASDDEDRAAAAADDADEGGRGEDDGRRRRGRRTRRSSARSRDSGADGSDDDGDEAEEIDDLGSEDAMEEVPVRQSRPRKQYKIQEVIKRRQILLVQVVKEERGNKGAALTTYLSLAGRYSVLMPNTARGGGISRKITNAADRKRLKEVVRDLDVPRGMGIILRTAGANRTKAEVKRDYEYLMRLWETVRTVTLSSIAPALVYEEGSLIKRSIRDLYNKDIDQILVSGEAGYREAKDFMRMLMPSQAKVVQPYRDPTPIFARQGIEAQLDKMLQPHVTLKSGGYIIINQTEALVAIDVNSGRSTREHSIEDTAFQTNLEAAEEVARQLRLRDLAGLIVIDFIDMEEKRNNRSVEKKLKDCLKNDRARIQVGKISHFGLMEMSRQRIRASVLESTMQPCPICGGAGHIRSASSLALHVVRSIEEHLQKHAGHDLIVKVPTATALYVLNEKRKRIDELEQHFGLRITIEADESAGHQAVSIEHGAPASQPVVRQEAAHPESVAAIDEVEEAEDEAVAEEVETKSAEEEKDDGDGGKRRRRRRRRRRGDRGQERGQSSDDGWSASGDEDDGEEADNESDEAEGSGDEDSASDADGGENGENGDDGENGDNGDRGSRRRRRGRRGGRRHRDGTGDLEGGDAVAARSDEADEVGGNAAAAADMSQPATGDVVTAAGAVETSGASDADTGSTLLGAGEQEESGENTETPIAVTSTVIVPETGADHLSAPSASPASEDAAPAESLAPPAAQDAPAALVAEIETADAATEASQAEQPAANDDAPAPAERTEPVVTSTSAEEAAGEDDKPRRTGWWARRSFF